MSELEYVGKRLAQTFQLLDKESFHLSAVVERLFKGKEMNREILDKLLNSPDGIDRLESFGAKFSRMQDTFVDKMLPLFLQHQGEKVGTAIENLNKAEKLLLLENVEGWLAARYLRNKLVHEYIDELLGALNLSRQFEENLQKSLLKFKAFSL